jgi:hypothetical protein
VQGSCEHGNEYFVAVGRGQFENPGREASVVGSRYQRTGEGQQTNKTTCVYSEP